MLPKTYIAVLGLFSVGLANPIYDLRFERHPDLRIINGSDASEGQFPFMVSFQGWGEHFCGGSLIDFQHILTAAHCCYAYTDGDFEVIAGIYDLNQTGVVRNIEKVIMHPEFVMTDTDVKNDICVLRLDKPLEESENIKIISLENTENNEVRNSTVLGWGTLELWGDIPNVLQYLNTEIVPNDQCIEQFGEKAFYPIRTSQVCAFIQKYQGICHRDSGGPLIVTGSDGEPVQIGIASWVYPCAQGYPDVYTRVSFYIDWIKNVTTTEVIEII